jgi:hypothetical protein
VTSWAFQGQRSSGEGTTSLGKALPGCLCGTSSSSLVQTPLSRLCPCWGLNIHLVGSSSPWRSELIISPCVPIQFGTYSSGMILHINSYALHGLISHRDHSNVNHIQSSILLNICIKPLLPVNCSKTLHKSARQVWRNRQGVLFG